MLDGN
jgi:WD40 repeat protein